MWIKQHDDSRLGRRELFELNGKMTELEVYRLPVELLRYNIRNGRFAAELREREAALGRQLNPEDGEDAKELEKLLLKNTTQASYLRDDILRIGQLRPGVITQDGAIIDGNRRVAVMKQLYQETSNSRYLYFDTVRLPSVVSPRDLWRIEAGIQLSADLKASYGPVNELLKIKEGIDAKLSFNEVAAILGGSDTADTVKEKLERLSLIESYLKFIGEPDTYSEAERRVEHFINLQNVMGTSGFKKLSDAEKAQLLQTAFEFIKSGVPHLQIRSLRKIVQDKEAVREVISETKKYSPPPKKSVPAAPLAKPESAEDAGLIDAILEVAKAEPQVADDPEDDDADDGGRGADGKELRENYLEIIANGVDRVDAREKDAKPAKLLKKAANAIDALKDLKPNKLKPLVPGLKKLSARLAALVERAQD